MTDATQTIPADELTAKMLEAYVKHDAARYEALIDQLPEAEKPDAFLRLYRLYDSKIEASQAIRFENRGE